MDDAHEFPNTNLVRLEKWFKWKKRQSIDYGFDRENSFF